MLPNHNGTAPGQWIEDGGPGGGSAARPAAGTEAHVPGPLPAAPAAAGAQAGDPHALLPCGRHAGVRSGSAHRAGLQAVRQSGHHHPGRAGRHPDSSARALCGRSGSRGAAGRGGRQDRGPAGRQDLLPPRRAAGGSGREAAARARRHPQRGRELHRRPAGRADHVDPRQFRLLHRRLPGLHQPDEDQTAGRRGAR